jgi:histidinol-phosphate aminotransferase
MTSSHPISLPFIRSELSEFQAYTPHPGGAIDPQIVLDRLDTNENPYDLPAELKQKLAHIWEREIESNRYPDGAHSNLKSAIAGYVSASAQGTSITSSQISVGNGSDELIRSILIATCIGGGGSILVAQPTFSMYGILAQTLGIPVVTVNRSPVNWEIDLEAANAAIANPDSAEPIRVVFVVHPNSPTANALSNAEIEWLRQLPSNILVVIDEAYFEFSQHTLVTELADRPNWIVLRTFSKAFRLAAHRVGYAIAHPDLIAILERVRLPYNLPSITLAAAQLALEHHQSLLAVIPEILDSRDRMYASLSSFPNFQVWRSNANFIYARLQPQGELDIDAAMASLVTKLKSQGTLIRHTGGGLRITIGSPAENQRTLDRLVGSWELGVESWELRVGS